MEIGRGRAYLLITVLLHRSTIRFNVRGSALDYRIFEILRLLDVKPPCSNFR
jgi:hypothetical protein